MNLYIDTVHGYRIREKRQEKGLTAQSLADMVGTYRERILLTERGKALLYMNEIRRIAEILDTPLEYFWQ